MHEAAQRGETRQLQQLIESGACVNQVTVDSITPLHAASLQGQAQCVQLLLAAGAQVSHPETPSPRMGWTDQLQRPSKSILLCKHTERKETTGGGWEGAGGKEIRVGCSGCPGRREGRPIFMAALRGGCSWTWLLGGHWWRERDGLATWWRALHARGPGRPWTQAGCLQAWQGLGCRSCLASEMRLSGMLARQLWDGR